MPGASFDTGAHANPNLDPLQGFDIAVTTVSGTLAAGGATPGTNSVLAGAFTSAMFKVVNQTETYLPLNSRLPKHLDGEIVIVYALEQGMIDPNVIANTYGSDFSDALKRGRGFKIPRSQRFAINFTAVAGVDGGDAALNDPAVFWNDNFKTINADKASMAFTLLQARVDTFSFGMTAGRHIVANSWQGTAESIQVTYAEKADGSAGTAGTDF